MYGVSRKLLAVCGWFVLMCIGITLCTNVKALFPLLQKMKMK